MIGRFLLGWLCLLLIAPARADSQLAVYFDQPTAKVGEPRRLVVELRTDSWFRRTAPMPALAVDGAVVLTPEGFAQSYTERRDGVTYAVLKRELLVVPQRPGALRVAPILLEVWDGEREQAQRLASDPVTLAVLPIPGLAAGERPPVASGLRLTESYSHDRREVRVGAGLTRRIEIRLEGSAAMFIEPLQLPLPQPEGVRLYRDRPQLTERTQRGRIEGERVETHTYVFERAGAVRLPAVRVRWWNQRTGRLEVAALPERLLAIVAGATPEKERAAGGWLMMVLLAALLLALTGLGLRWRVSAERRQFATLLACGRRTPAGTRVRALYRWLDRLNPHPAPLRRGLDGDEVLTAGLEASLGQLYAGGRGAVDAPKCAWVPWRLWRWRRRLLSASRRRRTPLPTLNDRHAEAGKRSG